MRTIDDIIAGRELIMATDVKECFQIKTGRSIGPNTLAAWRAMDPTWSMQPPGQRYWLYDWPRLWAWYRTYSQAHKGHRSKLAKSIS